MENVLAQVQQTRILSAQDVKAHHVMLGVAFSLGNIKSSEQNIHS
jgi:hypothetical protein